MTSEAILIGHRELPPPLTPEAVAYGWRQLLYRAGFDPADVPLWYGDPAHAPASFRGVVVIPCAQDAFDRLLQRPPGTLDTLPPEQAFPADAPSPLAESIPILFWGAGRRRTARPLVARRDGGGLILYADLIAAAFFMLSRWEETVVPSRDEHGRFPAVAGVAYKQGFLLRPIVDEYALLLRAWLAALSPRREPRPRHFAVRLSHDIDHVRPFPTWKQGMRVLGGDLLKRRSLSQARRTLSALVTQTLRPAHTAELKAVADLADLAARHNLKAVFYFMAADPAPYDSGYDPARPPVRSLLKRLDARGFEIGLHPGYHTLGDPERLAREKARLDAILGRTDYGGRQHYLRFRVPDTWRDGERVGLAHDSTLGYADHEGFRCGTCHPFRPFDVQQNREMDLREYPPIVMDRTLRGYRRLTPDRARDRILSLARRCRRVEGTFTLLWHPAASDDDGLWTALYREILSILSRWQEGRD